jgi:hypothetical protein
MSEKIEAFWGNATADDVARVMSGKTVEARFRDCEHAEWFASNLGGWTTGKHRWYSSNVQFWVHCQVYREPSWHANKPDPGPGFRLLEKFPPEAKLGTDDYWSILGQDWTPVGSGDSEQHEQVWYRRRIEPVEPKFAVGQTVRVVGPKATDVKHWSEDMNKHLGKESAVSNRESKDAGWFYQLGCSAVWVFREDYLEAVEAEPKHYVLRVGYTATIPNSQTITITAKGFEVTQ